MERRMTLKTGNLGNSSFLLEKQKYVIKMYQMYRKT